MDRAGIETMLMNYYRYMDKSKVQFDFLCNKKKPGAYDDEIKSMGGRIYHTPGLNPAKYPEYLKFMRKLFHEHPEYKIVEAHNGALGVYALHAAKVSKIPVRIFHAHGASITKDWKLPIKLVCKAMLPANMNEHYSCGVEAARCYFGNKVVGEKDYVLIPNAINISNFVFNELTREKIRRENGLDGKHVIGHVSTAYMNDCEPLLCFAQQINGYGTEGDVFLGISTSGNSKNILYAAVTAHAKGMKVIGLTGATPDRFHQVEEDFKAGRVAAKNLSNKQKAVFLDRDGTINKYVGFLRNINEFELINGVAEAIKKINAWHLQDGRAE